MGRTANVTRQSILSAARDLLRQGGKAPSVGAVAARAGVSRLSVYHHFGSHEGLLEAVASGATGPAAAGDLQETIAAAVRHWASDPALFRRLHTAVGPPHELASTLAAADRLRPGCSIKEAEDVLAILTSFAAFDGLHQDGRRSAQAVIEILMRMAGSILQPQT